MIQYLKLLSNKKCLFNNNLLAGILEKKYKFLINYSVIVIYVYFNIDLM